MKRSSVLMSQIVPTPSVTKSAEPTNSTAALGRVLVVEDNSSEVVVLTAQEFEALQFLVHNPDCAISRDELLKGVWGYQNCPSTLTGDNRILRLRQKLERDIARPLHLCTCTGWATKFVH
jgi:DNA-binding response OmpR family regulator